MKSYLIKKRRRRKVFRNLMIRLKETFKEKGSKEKALEIKKKENFHNNNPKMDRLEIRSREEMENN